MDVEPRMELGRLARQRTCRLSCSPHRNPHGGILGQSTKLAFGALWIDEPAFVLATARLNQFSLHSVEPHNVAIHYHTLPCYVRVYHSTLVPKQIDTFMPSSSKKIEVERIQTGVRVERRILKVLKALAEYKNMTLGDLLEGIVLHAFDGKAPFTAETLRKIAELKGIYELDLDARASHRLKER